jgi:histidyl-tRNA synthetase
MGRPAIGKFNLLSISMSASARINAPQGTNDLLPIESWKWQAVEAAARQSAALFHYGEIRTPIFEHSELFHRGIGEGTDIVGKETYTFNDRGGRSLTLRPEGTAGVARAMIENGLLNDAGSRVKVFYIGPNFRYERPQKGRLRQHHQFGAEAFGIAEAEQDVECILLQLDFYRRCGLRDLALRVNSLGDGESKGRYRDTLVAHLSPRAESLGEDSRRRLAANPLRILDSKDPADIKAVADAPPAYQFLSDASRAHFDRVVELLTRAGVAFSKDGRLVRGFDYYTGTLWEVTAAGLGSQDAVGGGGRYDGLVAELGGPATPGVGFGSGLERLLMALEAQKVALPEAGKKLVWLVAHGNAARDHNLKLIGELRAGGFAADMDLSGRAVKSQFKLADREKAAVCVVIGDQELVAGSVVIKDLGTGKQETVARDRIVEVLRGMVG